MNTFMVIRLAQTAANCALGLGLLAGGALVARRSVTAGGLFAIAGFCEVGTEIVQRTLSNPAFHMRLPFVFENGGNLYDLIQLIKVCGVLGVLVFAVRALPARTA